MVPSRLFVITTLPPVIYLITPDDLQQCTREYNQGYCLAKGFVEYTPRLQESEHIEDVHNVNVQGNFLNTTSLVSNLQHSQEIVFLTPNPNKIDKLWQSLEKLLLIHAL